MKYVVGLMLAALTCVAHAEKKPLACQGDAAAGLSWKDGQWQASKFVTRKYVLVLDGKALTTESVAKMFGNDYPNQIKCNTSNQPGYISCMDAGGSLFFNPITNKGSVAFLFGGGQAYEEKKDTVTVETFSCTPF